MQKNRNNKDEIRHQRNQKKIDKATESRANSLRSIKSINLKPDRFRKNERDREKEV